MQRSLLAALVVLVSVVGPSFAEEASIPASADCVSDSSTLRLYFAPAVTNVGRGQSGFVPEVARLYVDGQFVGNAIVNLHGHLPTLKFGAGSHTIRVEMDNDREFKSKITFLGRGSIQYLFVEFDSKPVVATR